jgi:hypothetical protein
MAITPTFSALAEFPTASSSDKIIAGAPPAGNSAKAKKYRFKPQT